MHKLLVEARECSIAFRRSRWYRRARLVFSGLVEEQVLSNALHPAVELLPAVVHLLGDPDLATDVAYRYAVLDVLQDGRRSARPKNASSSRHLLSPMGRIMPLDSH